ncbi:MAG: rRNA maturation RNase YbeY [Elusimicrobia bacterium GWA2_69_24]|nr:MAG: rRNA maturation RNase YbeY [Elusimicrobia bacterium GWA2_69_24]HBL17747.1 rRNA maturation RNase YbeY [Elusimicrobiota bacterium]
MKVTLLGAGKLKPAQRRLVTAAVLQGLGARRRRRGELCLALVTDRGIRSLNRRFLGQDRPTDVIAFPYPESGPGAAAPSDESPFGDIAVSLGAVRRQSRALGHPPFKELLTLAAHGALHLAGYDDGRAADRERMFRRQERIVASLFKA